MRVRKAARIEIGQDDVIELQAVPLEVEQLQEALSKPEDRDEAIKMLRRLIEGVIVRQAEEGLQIELVGEIVRLVELGLDGKRAALSAEEVC